MSDGPVMKGGCLCGAVRYDVTGEPFATEYCHCRMCQRSAGAVFLNWMDFMAEQVTWTEGAPKEYPSSEHLRRGFCEKCGTSLSARDLRYPEYASLTIASLDDPNQVEPTCHIYTESQLRWLTIDDDCERFGQNKTRA